MKKKTTLKWRRVNLYKDTVVEVEGFGVGKKNLDKIFRKNKAIQKENIQKSERKCHQRRYPNG